jgi:hypothetical protein
LYLAVCQSAKWHYIVVAGLPDGMFQTKHPNLYKFLDGLAMKDVGKCYGLFYCHFVYFVAILAYFVVYLVYFSSFGMLCQEKSGNPAL